MEESIIVSNIHLNQPEGSKGTNKVSSKISIPNKASRVRSRSPPLDKKDSKKNKRNRSSSSSSRSHHSRRDSCGSRRKGSKHRRRRSPSSSSSRSPGKKSDFESTIRRVVDVNLKAALEPLCSQLQRMESSQSQNQTSVQGQDSVSTVAQELFEIRSKQKDLSIESKVSSLNTPGAKSQYRCIATIDSKLESVLVKLDELTLSLDSPEDPLYQALSTIREEVQSASDLASDRADSIFRADLDPKNGWVALTLYDEKVKQGKSDPEKDKLFASCLKQVQDDRKKKTFVSSKQASGLPFRGVPGSQPGFNSYPGIE
jgi:hypothetical protein